jgi:hypothetical protein
MPANPAAPAPALALCLPKPTARNRHERRAAAHHERAAWRIPEWLDEVPISRSKFYEERNEGRIATVKVGSATLITTSPREYLASLATAPAGCTGGG